MTWKFLPFQKRKNPKMSLCFFSISNRRRHTNLSSRLRCQLHVREEKNLRYPFDSRLSLPRASLDGVKETKYYLNLESQPDSQVVLPIVQTWLFPFSISVRIGHIRPIFEAKIKCHFIASFKWSIMRPNSRLNCNMIDKTTTMCYRAIIKCKENYSQMPTAAY
jgi:hypothetical protein